jgi:hypothetical protein
MKGAKQFSVHGVGHDFERAAKALVPHHLRRLGVATDHEVGALEHVRAHGFKRRRQGLLDVLLGFDQKFGAWQDAVTQPGRVRRNHAPRLLPEVDDVGLEAAQQGGQTGVEVRVVLRRAEPRQGHVPDREAKRWVERRLRVPPRAIVLPPVGREQQQVQAGLSPSAWARGWPSVRDWQVCEISRIFIVCKYSSST